MEASIAGFQKVVTMAGGRGRAVPELAWELV